MRPIHLGIVLAGLGFGQWSLMAQAEAPSFVWPGIVRVAACVLILVGLRRMAAGRGPRLFRYGLFGFLVAAILVVPDTLGGNLDWPNLISTLAGTLGALAVAYGAAHWFEPRGDALAAAWVAAGFALMAANPGTYVVAGLLAGDLAQGGWGLGSWLAMAGCALVAATVGQLADPRPAGLGGDAARPGGRRAGT